MRQIYVLRSARLPQRTGPAGTVRSATTQAKHLRLHVTWDPPKSVEVKSIPNKKP